jgi:amidase
MDIDDLGLLDATEQAALVKAKSVKPRELVKAAIKRIEERNPTINAVTAIAFETALEAADRVKGDEPFAGVPLLLKDHLAACKELPSTESSTFLRGYRPGFDSEIVRRLRKGGFIILGRTNVPEYAILPTTEPRLFGATRNPWDITRSTGGSSGGSAAAVASRMVAVAHGNDGGGSIRVPASCCGVFGLKPTRGRNPLGPTYGELIGGMVAEHALTVTVRDSAAMLDVTAGADVGDPYWAPPNARPFTTEVGAPLAPLRIGFTTKALFGDDIAVHPDCVAAVDRAVSVCQDLGQRVEEARPQFNSQLLSSALDIVASSGDAASLADWSRTVGKPLLEGSVEPESWALYRSGKSYSAVDYVLARQDMHLISRQIARFFDKYDVLITPVIAEPPLPLGSFESTSDNPNAAWEKCLAFVPFTPIANVTGQPAMSVPLHWNREGLPIGIHFLGRFGEEGTLFSLAGQLEEAVPWKTRLPAVVAPVRDA